MMQGNGGRLNPEQEAQLAGVFNDELAYLATFVGIPSKGGGPTVPFVPWPVQARVARNLLGRDIIVKDSQIGCTSIITGIYLKRTITIPNTTTVIVAHEEGLTQRLLRRVQVMFDSIPEQIKPEQDHRSDAQMRFPDINSVMYIGTARAQVFGRGEPIHNLLFSEEAHYIEGAHEKIVVPSLQRVPPGGSVVRESTPNGEQGEFYEETQKALRKESTFRLHLMYWFQNPDNWLRGDSGLLLADDKVKELTLEERKLIREHNLTWGQIFWRRWKIRESGAMFWQEHFESLETCFLTIGQPYYSPEVVVAARRECFRAEHVGPGNAVVWYKPVPEGVYVMSTDPGQGITTESVTQVWRVALEDHYRHEARISGLYEPEPMARMSADLGRWYNNALWIPEANAHGIGLIAKAVAPPIQYPRMYWRRHMVSGKLRNEIGWLTSPSTKPIMMQELQRLLPRLKSHDSEFWRQVSGWRDIGQGRAETVTADDHHDAGALMAVGALSVTPNAQRGYRGNTGHTSWDD